MALTTFIMYVCKTLGKAAAKSKSIIAGVETRQSLRSRVAVVVRRPGSFVEARAAAASGWTARGVFCAFVCRGLSGRGAPCRSAPSLGGGVGALERWRLQAAAALSSRRSAAGVGGVKGLVVRGVVGAACVVGDSVVACDGVWQGGGVVVWVVPRAGSLASPTLAGLVTPVERVRLAARRLGASRCPVRSGALC